MITIVKIKISILLVLAILMYCCSNSKKIDLSLVKSTDWLSLDSADNKKSSYINILDTLINYSTANFFYYKLIKDSLQISYPSDEDPFITPKEFKQGYGRPDTSHLKILSVDSNKLVLSNVYGDIKTYYNDLVFRDSSLNFDSIHVQFIDRTEIVWLASISPNVTWVNFARDSLYLNFKNKKTFINILNKKCQLALKNLNDKNEYLDPENNLPYMKLIIYYNGPSKVKLSASLNYNPYTDQLLSMIDCCFANLFFEKANYNLNKGFDQKFIDSMNQ